MNLYNLKTIDELRTFVKDCDRRNYFCFNNEYPFRVTPIPSPRHIYFVFNESGRLGWFISTGNVNCSNLYDNREEAEKDSVKAQIAWLEKELKEAKEKQV